MKSNKSKISCKRGFTLIELLVVILIIGILAAVAVPQYQKAVIKSQLIQGIIFVRAVYEAQKVYFLGNGQYASSLNDLDIKVDCPTGVMCVMGAEGLPKATAVHPKGVQILLYYGNASVGGVPAEGKLYCWAPRKNAQAVNICKSFGPELFSNDSGVRHLIQ